MSSVAGVKRCADAGAGAVVLKSLFEEQILQEQAAYRHLMEAGAESFAEALNYFPESDAADRCSDRYLELIDSAITGVDIPVIASLNGVSAAGWPSVPEVGCPDRCRIPI